MGKVGYYLLAGVAVAGVTAKANGWSNPETSPNYYSFDPAATEAAIAEDQAAEEAEELQEAAAAAGAELIEDTQYTHQVMPGEAAPLDVSYDCTSDVASNQAVSRFVVEMTKDRGEPLRPFEIVDLSDLSNLPQVIVNCQGSPQS